MAAEGDRLTAMINDVLDLQKIEAGRMEFRREPVDVVAVVDQACAAVASLFEASGLELVREVPATLPEITGDHHRLIQVVINLLSNAVKFTAHGTITVRASVATAPAGGDEVVVSVADTGSGIPPEDRERVFEAFAQSGDPLTDKPRGTGLGLPISREIVDRARRPDVARERGRPRLDVLVRAARGAGRRLTRGIGRGGPGRSGPASRPPWKDWIGRQPTSVLEEELPVLRQRPVVVGDDGLELVGGLAQRVLSGDDPLDERPAPPARPCRPRGPRAGRARAPRSAPPGSSISPPTRSQAAAIPRDAPDAPAAARSARCRAAAGRIIVRAMSSAVLASMFETFT